MKLKLLAVQSRLRKVNYSPTPVVEAIPPITGLLVNVAFKSRRWWTPTFYQGSRLFLET